MANPLVKEFKVDNQIIEIKDQNARDRITELEKCDERGWFFIADSYGMEGLVTNSFTARLKNNGFIVDELSVGMMSYGGNSINVIPQLTQKLSTMTVATIESITDIVSCLGLNDTWDNYNVINLARKVEEFVDFCIIRFPNLQRIHLAPIGNEMDKAENDAEDQAFRNRAVQYVIKKTTGYNSKVMFVDNSQIAMNCPYFFQSDCVHPNAEGSEMLFDNFLSYMRNGNFPINTFSDIHPEDALGWRYMCEWVGSASATTINWSSNVAEFTVNGASDFDPVFLGEVQLPLMRKVQVNVGILMENTSSGIKRAGFGIVGLIPKDSTHSNMIITVHANTGGNTPEYYNKISFYATFANNT